MKSKLLAMGLTIALLTSVSASPLAQHASAAAPTAPVASTSHAHIAFLDKTRFVLDLGVAYFCLHHVYKNYKHGLYARGAPSRIRHIIAAALILAIAYDRMHKAYSIANNSSSPTLHKLVSPLNKLLSKLHRQQSDFAGGYLSDSDYTSMNKTADSFGGSMTNNGLFFHDVSVPLPGGA